MAAKNPVGLGNANAKPKPTGVLKRSEAAEERSGWNCWLIKGDKVFYCKNRYFECD